MRFLTQSETDFLEALALYKFLTNPQIEALGVKKGAANVRQFSKQFMGKYPGVIERVSMGVRAQAGKIPHLYYLTPKGADFVAETLEIDPGNITYGDMVDNFPHFRKWGDKGGKVSRARVSGFLLKKILELLANSELGLQVMIDGVEAKGGAWDPRRDRVSEARIDGQRLSGMRYYTIALPSEVPFGMLKLMNVFGFVLLNELEEIKGADYWPLLEDYIKKNSPLRCLED